MRFKINIPEPVPEPLEGDTRIVERFAWLPIIIEDIGETEIRWLETCKVKQFWTKDVFTGDYYTGRWKNLEFVDEEQKADPQPVQE